MNFESKLERVQYNAYITFTIAIQGTNSARICTELDLQSWPKYFAQSKEIQ